MSMSYSQYMKEAQLAVEYVKSKITVGASNKASDVIRTGGVMTWLLTIGMPQSVVNTFNLEEWQWSLVKGGEDSVSKTVAMRSDYRDLVGDTKGDVYFKALVSEKYGAGNCGEQSAIAFSYLYSRGVFPIDWCYFDQKGKDHAFVIINAKAKITPNNFSEWSDSAICCDPWAGRVELAGYLPKRWGCHKVSSYFHADGKSSGGFAGIDSRY